MYVSMSSKTRLEIPWELLQAAYNTVDTLDIKRTPDKQKLDRDSSLENLSKPQTNLLKQTISNLEIFNC